MRHRTTRFVFVGVLLLALASGGRAFGAEQAKSRGKANSESAMTTIQAPETFRVRFDTTTGPVLIEVIREWAPRGADRFYTLVKDGFFTDIAFFRVIKEFIAQFGIHGKPEIAAKWRNAPIPDDPVRQSNLRGFISFAMAGPNTRTTQMFINFGNNSRLDRSGFAPFGRVIEGMENLDNLFSGYGEGAPRGQGPSQELIESQGNTYLRRNFPHLDYIKSATLVDEGQQ